MLLDLCVPFDSKGRKFLAAKRWLSLLPEKIYDITTKSLEHVSYLE